MTETRILETARMADQKHDMCLKCRVQPYMPSSILIGQEYNLFFIGQKDVWRIHVSEFLSVVSSDDRILMPLSDKPGWKS